MPGLSIWEKTRELLQAAIGETAYDTWLKPLKVVLSDKERLILTAPDDFFKAWVEQRYLSIINDSLLKTCGYPVIIEIQALPAEVTSSFIPPSVPVKTADNTRQETPQLKLNPRYTFDNFVVGGANRFAHAAAMAVAENPAKSYNPFFIYGGVGLGKTHLMQAICHYAVRKNTNVKICYLPSERFTNELIDAIQHRSTQAFRQKYRYADILVIDDIHFIAGKESTQEEFFHTFNALYDAHKQIIISSDRPPKEISNLEERLISRFGWGLITDIQMPDFETRVAILKKKIENEPVSVPEDVIYFIAESIKTNIRELEGALIRVVASSLLEEKPITLHQAKERLKDTLKESKKNITVEMVQKKVCDFFGISTADLKTKKRNKNIVFPRQIAMYVCRELTELSLPEIGDCFGGKDHTTVLHAYNKIVKDIHKDRSLEKKIREIINSIQQ